MAAPKMLEVVLALKDRMSAGLSKAKGELKGLSSIAGGVSKALGPVGTAIAAIGAGVGLQKLIEVNVEFERLRAQLRAFARDDADAAGQFDMIRQFAVETPYELQDLTQAWISLRAAGLKPTVEEFRALGDVASAVGQPIDEMGVAIKSAVGGSVERLNKMGVTARLVGDKIAISFQGQTTMVNRSSKAVMDYFVQLREAAGFTGAMERQTKTLGGALSNLQDAVSNLLAAIGEGGFGRAAASFVRWMTKMTGAVEEYVKARFGGYADPIATEMAILDVQEQQAALIGKMANFGIRGARVAEIKAAAAARDLQAAAAMMPIERELFQLEQQRLELEREANKTAADARRRAQQDAADRQAQEARELAEASAAAAAEQAKADAARAKALEQAVKLGAVNLDLVGQIQSALERDRAVLAAGNLTLEERVALLQRIKDLAEAGAAATGQITRAGVTATASTLPPLGRGPSGVAGITPRMPGAPKGGTDIITQVTTAANQARENLDVDIVGGVLSARDAFDALGRSVESAFAAMVDGSMSAGQALATSMASAVASVASSLAQLYYGKAAAAIAEGIATKDPSQFKAAAQYTLAGTLMSALSGSLQGAVNKSARSAGLGGGGPFGVVPVGTGVSARPADATIVIEGGLLDMSNPRQADALARALGTLSGRRVRIEGVTR